MNEPAPFWLGPDSEVEVRFATVPFSSQVVHWINEGHRWTAVPCKAKDCDRCLSVDNWSLQQRYTATIRLDPVEVRTLDMAPKLFRVINARRHKEGAKFYSKKWKLSRYGHGLYQEFRIEEVK